MWWSGSRNSPIAMAKCDVGRILSAGYVQWATAKEFPPHLATIVPVASPYIGVDFPCATISRALHDAVVDLRWGHTSQDKLFSNNEFYWGNKFRHWLESGLPSKSSIVSRNPSAIFQEWITHPKQDAYWDSYNPSSEQYAKTSIPILTITGSYDDDQPGALMHYREHLKNASSRDRAAALSRDWPVGSRRYAIPKAEFAGLKVGSASLVDLAAATLQWYAWTMQDGRKARVPAKERRVLRHGRREVALRRLR